MTPTKLSFEQRYSDDSGVEFGVSYDASRLGYDSVTIKRVGEIGWPIEQLDWLIDALVEVRNVTKKSDHERDGHGRIGRES